MPKASHTALNIVTAGIAALALTTTAPLPAAAQSEMAGPGAGAASASLSEQDREFARSAAMGGKRNVVLSEVVLSRSEHDATTQFAKGAKKRFMQAGKQLKLIAKELKLDLPQEPGENTKELREGLQELDSPLLEREYTWNMLAAASVAENLFEEQVEEGSHPKLVGFAEKALPKIRQHRRNAAELWAELNE